jgi:hypothetical protein
MEREGHVMRVGTTAEGKILWGLTPQERERIEAVGLGCV